MNNSNTDIVHDFIYTPHELYYVWIFHPGSDKMLSVDEIESSMRKQYDTLSMACTFTEIAISNSILCILNKFDKMSDSDFQNKYLSNTRRALSAAPDKASYYKYLTKTNNTLTRKTWK